MNQRKGKMHAASGFDAGHKVDLQQLIRTVRDAQSDLEKAGEEDSALRFEIFGDYLEEDVAQKGKPLTYNARMLGL